MMAVVCTFKKKTNLQAVNPAVITAGIWLLQSCLVNYDVLRSVSTIGFGLSLLFLSEGNEQ